MNKNATSMNFGKLDITKVSLAAMLKTDGHVQVEKAHCPASGCERGRVDGPYMCQVAITCLCGVRWQYSKTGSQCFFDSPSPEAVQVRPTYLRFHRTSVLALSSVFGGTRPAQTGSEVGSTGSRTTCKEFGWLVDESGQRCHA
jgi:hypothetical protein